MCGDDCHTCDFPGQPGACSVCRNYKALDEATGQCVDQSSCDAISGTGMFGLKCVRNAPFQLCLRWRIEPDRTQFCSCRRAGNGDCHACDHDGTTAGACRLCKNAMALNASSGFCVDPVTCSRVMGSGNFGLECVTEPTEIASRCAGRDLFSSRGTVMGRCSCGLDCYACAFTTVAGACTRCRNGKVLDTTTGECFDREHCSSVSGTGRFDLTCIGRRTHPADNAEQCLPPLCRCPENCETCITRSLSTGGNGPVCIRCGNSTYLRDDTCVNIANCPLPFGLFEEHLEVTQAATSGGRCCSENTECRQKLALFISDNPPGADDASSQSATRGLVEDGIKTFTLSIGPFGDSFAMWSLTTFGGRYGFGETAADVAGFVDDLFSNEVCGN